MIYRHLPVRSDSRHRNDTNRLTLRLFCRFPCNPVDLVQTQHSTHVLLSELA